MVGNPGGALSTPPPSNDPRMTKDHAGTEIPTLAPYEPALKEPHHWLGYEAKAIATRKAKSKQKRKKNRQ